MNRDQVKGTLKDKAGKAQRKMGQAMESPKHIAKGAARQAEGKVQKAAGNAREDAKNRGRM
jgi:uncharacterized protein YjbJ (UPF0337 family)